MEDRLVGVGLAGTGFMARAHSLGYREAATFFPSEVRLERRAICGRDKARAERVARREGWQAVETCWERLVERADVDLVDVAVPGHLHAPLAVAAAGAHKAVLCEKPLANGLAEAQAMLAAVRSAGVVHAVAFNNRFLPALQAMRTWVRDGRLGEIRHVRATWQSEASVDPDRAGTWRDQAETAGTGALGDLGAHLIDLTRYVVGEILEVTGRSQTFVDERPRADAPDGRVPVTVDDATAFLARLDCGGMAVFEATRSAVGYPDRFTFEVNGTAGSVRFDRHRANELGVYWATDDPARRGFTTLHVSGPDWPLAAPWWPPGHGIEYGETWVNLVGALARRLAGEPSPDLATFEDGERCQAVLDAVECSVRTGAWASVVAQPPR